MLRSVDPNSVKIVNGNEKTYALHEAARIGHAKIMMVMQCLLGFPLLFYFVQALIASGADVNLQYQRGNGELWDTPLHIAAWTGHLSAGVHIKCVLKLYHRYLKYQIYEFNTHHTM